MLSMKTLKISYLLLLLTIILFACQKEFSFEGVVTPAGTWQFNDDTKLYAGNIDSAYIETTGTTKTLNLIGKSSDGSQNFLLHLYATDSFTIGTYKASVFETDFQYYTPSKTLYQADQFIGEFIVTITALGNNSITGIFSGAAEDSTNTVKPLTLGQFTSRINLSTNGTGGGGGGTATGILGASAGVCTPVTTAGTYTQGVALNSTNTATVQVTVTTPGTYTISTNTVNGVSFSGSGTFTATGVQSVILNGSGTPVASGNQTFAVTFGSSTCNFTINFGAGVPPATGTLGGAPGSCTPIVLAGTYTQGVALTSSNTVQVQVNVATTGSYTIATNTVNGVSLTGSGTFTTTGLQNVILTGSGTPVSAGSQNFIVTFGSSTCNFSITFNAGTSTGDYFPVTAGSNWAYGNTTTAGDSFFVSATSLTRSISGYSNPYNVFTYDTIPNSSKPDSLFYRKATVAGGKDYYENFDAEAYFSFDPGTTTPKNVEYIFLKDYVPVGTPWNSTNISGVQGGVTYTIYIKMTLFEKVTTPITVGAATSSDVLKVRYEYFLTTAPGAPFFTEERWFAKDIGMIYNSFNNGTNNYIYKVGRYQVF